MKHVNSIQFHFWLFCHAAGIFIKLSEKPTLAIAYRYYNNAIGGITAMRSLTKFISISRRLFFRIEKIRNASGAVCTVVPYRRSLSIHSRSLWR